MESKRNQFEQQKKLAQDIKFPLYNRQYFIYEHQTNMRFKKIRQMFIGVFIIRKQKPNIKYEMGKTTNDLLKIKLFFN